MDKAYLLAESERQKNERIIAGFKDSDNRIIYDCYEEIFPMVKKLVLYNSGDEEDARTVTMESLSAFFECCQKPNFKLTCKFSSFMYSISRNVWFKKLGKQKRYVGTIQVMEDVTDAQNEGAYVNPLSTEDYENNLQVNDLKRIIMEFANKISGKCSEVIRLKYMEDLMHDQIAEKLNIKVSASRKRLYDCNEKLAQRIIRSRYFEELKEEYQFFGRFVKQYLRRK